jgi:ribosome-binding protein aMBF1 (putative translation factor)
MNGSHIKARIIPQYPILGYVSIKRIFQDMSKTLHSPEHTKLRQLLQSIRQSRCLTQSELAKKLRRPQSFVSKYELGERRLDILELREVCLALEMDLHTFIDQLETAINAT